MALRAKKNCRHEAPRHQHCYEVANRCRNKEQKRCQPKRAQPSSNAPRYRPEHRGKRDTGQLNSREHAPGHARKAEAELRHQKPIADKCNDHADRYAAYAPQLSNDRQGYEVGREDALPPGSCIYGSGRTGNRVAQLATRAEQHPKREDLQRQDRARPLPTKKHRNDFSG